MCLYPKLIQNPKYLPNKKNNYNPPKCLDNRALLVPVGCGQCIECRKQKAREWQVRLNEEIRVNKTGNFVTLTFDEEHLKNLTIIAEKELINKIEENEIATLAVRRFLERWRKKYKKSVRHWLITELGHNGTERIHLHGIIFTEHPEEIERIWQNGYVYIGDYVNEKTINYCVKYMTKIDVKHKGYQPKILTSAGIGANYLTRPDAKNAKYNNKETKEYYITRQGTKLSLPVYYRNKLYSENEKEKLWLNKLDKQERWILGTKIDISKSEETYEKLLKQAQEDNIKLGYGNNSKDWTIETYKRQRKNLKKIEKNTLLLKKYSSK